MAVLAASLLCTAVAACTTPAETPPSSQRTDAQLTKGFPAESTPVTLRQLDHLPVSPPGAMTGYSRDAFPHWRDARDPGWPPAALACNARNAALLRDGDGVSVRKPCTLRGGSWFDPYTGSTLTSSAEIDIDHIVPLAAAWRSGASRWPAARRQTYANDPLVLVSVQNRANRAKGDKTADLWKPPNRDAWCLYAKRYVAVKHKYRLSVSSGEKRALATMAAACPG